MTRLQEVLATARGEGRAALVGYLPAGYPSVEGAVEAMRAIVDAGVDAVEVGLPYSDPVMDGPAIQAAAQAALERGTRTADVLRTAGAVADTGAAALVMSYWNPVQRYGAERFATDLVAAGGSGTITPDLTPDEGGAWIDAARAAGLDTVFLVAPSSSDARLRSTAQACRGFVYAASTMGVTGGRGGIDSAAAGLVARTRLVTTTPVCVGLGVSTPDQAAEVAAYADGVIVGSALVRCLLEADSPREGVRAVAELAGRLAEGVRRGRHGVTPEVAAPVGTA